MSAMNRYVNSLTPVVDSPYNIQYKREHKKYLAEHDALEFRPDMNYWALALDTVIQLDKKDLKNQQGAEFCRDWYEDMLRRKYEVSNMTDLEVNMFFFNDWTGNLGALFKKQFKYKPEKPKDKMFAFLTFNFHPDTTILTAQMEMKRIFQLSVFRDLKITYSIEYHGNGENHIHFHALIEYDEDAKKNMNKSILDRFIFKTQGLKDYLSVQYQFSTGKGSFRADPNIDKYEDYVAGNKAESKMHNVRLDIEWRHKYNLDDIYKINH